jgi:subtilisin family serine protease
MGIGGGCSLLAVRIAYSPAPQADWVTSNAVIRRAIDWAWQRGRADVLSNSWGGGAPSTAITNAFERARTQGRGGKGCVIVIAAGNASGPVDFPGNFSNMLTVSASNEHDEPKTTTSQDGEFWWGANFGPEVVVAAPGVHNYTTDISGEKGYNPGGTGAVVDANYVHNFNGTSSATPIVAGAVGLVLSANRNLTEAQVREVIRDSADKVGSVPYVNGRNDRMGYGRLNVYRAVQTALGLGLSVQGQITKAAPASFVLRTNTGEEFLLRRYQGSEGVSWHLLENQNLVYLAQFEGQQVMVQYSRRQDSGQGSILWGASVVS